MNSEYAVALRQELGLKGRLDVYELLIKIGLSAKQVDAQGFEGALIRSAYEMKGRILIKRSIREETRKRFTIAHEIGHYILHQDQQKLSCGAADIEQWQDGEQNPEREADEFASELLIPSDELQVLVGKRWPSLDLIKECADVFAVSLMAMARKYCQIVEQSCAIVWVQRGTIRWFHPSPTFHYWPKVGDKIGDGSVAARLLADQSVTGDMEEVSAEEWISSFWLRQGAVIKEQSLLMPYYDGCLALLWANREIENAHSIDDELLPELEADRFDSNSRKRWPGKR